MTARPLQAASAFEHLLYFEVASTLARAIGLVVGNIVKPGMGMKSNPATTVEAFAKGAMLQVILISVRLDIGLVPLGGTSMDRLPNAARAVTDLIGNGLATIAIAKSEGAFDQAQAARAYQEDLATA